MLEVRAASPIFNPYKGMRCHPRRVAAIHESRPVIPSPGQASSSAGGLQLRLRLAQPSDLHELRALIRRAEVHVDHDVLERLLFFDPRERAVICAAAWIGGREALVGVGAIDLEPGARPDL